MLSHSRYRQFLALVEFESKKKTKSAKEGSEYLDKFANGVKADEQSLMTHLHDLGVTAYVVTSIFSRIARLIVVDHWKTWIS